MLQLLPPFLRKATNFFLGGQLFFSQMTLPTVKSFSLFRACRWGLKYADYSSCKKVTPLPNKGCTGHDIKVHLMVRLQV